MSTGKRFEEDFNNSVDEKKDYIYRLRDNPTSFLSGSAKFTTSNICDFFMYNRFNNKLMLLELKTTKGKSLSFQNLKEKQRKEMCNINIEGVTPLYIINFSDLEETYAIGVKEVQAYIDKDLRKSIPIKFLRDNALKIEQYKKIIRYTYNIEKFLQEV